VARGLRKRQPSFTDRGIQDHDVPTTRLLEDDEVIQAPMQDAGPL